MASKSLKTSEGTQDQAAPVTAPLFDMKPAVTDLGATDSFRYMILVDVLNEKYDKAIADLQDYMQSESEYPQLKEKTQRYALHSIDLIHAIKAKRSFPGITSLTRSKQQEFREKFKEHFKELGQILKKIEKIEKDLVIKDVRSTLYVVHALWVAGLCIIVFAFWLEFVNGMARTGWDVFGDTVLKLTDFMFKWIED